MNATVRREARRRARQAEIAELERSVGFKPSTDANGLPHVTVHRNPEGSWLIGDRWTCEGFERWSYEHHGDVVLEPWAWTKRGCVRKARRLLRRLVERDLEGTTEVTL